jgi:hypothetical protein
MVGRGRRGGQGPLSTPRTTLSDRGETPSLLGSALLRCRLRARMATPVGAVPEGHAGQPRSDFRQHSGLKHLKSQYCGTGRESGRRRVEGGGSAVTPLGLRSEDEVFNRRPQ